MLSIFKRGRVQGRKKKEENPYFAIDRESTRFYIYNNNDNDRHIRTSEIDRDIDTTSS